MENDVKENNSYIEFLEELSERSYDASVAREQSILEQAGRMQMAFSFVIIAVLTAYGFTMSIQSNCVFHRFCFIMTCLISVTLILSLAFATYATYRFKYTKIAPIETLEQYVYKHPKVLSTPDGQVEKRNYFLKRAQESVDMNAEIRVNALLRSTWFFYGALGLIILTIVVGIFIAG